MKSQRRTDTTFGNSVVARREMVQKQQGHRQRISEIKSTLDTRPPAAQPHLTLYGRDYVSKKKATTEAAFGDLKMIQAIARTMTRKQHSSERKGPISLNADARKKEIYNIMNANHRLLENIESVNPVMRTKDLVKDHRDKIRYVINSSHTMRLSGEYDSEIDRIRKEDRDRFEATQRSTRMRMDASQRLRGANGGSVSLPSLTGTTRSDPGAGSGSGSGSAAGPPQRSPSESRAASSAAQPAQGSRRPAQHTPSRGPQATGAAQEPNEKSDASAAVAAKPSVHFSSTAGKGSPKQKTRRSGTPHPTKYTPGFDVPEEEANNSGADDAGAEPSAASRAAPEAPGTPAAASTPSAEPPAVQPGSPPAAVPAAAEEAPPAAPASPGPQSSGGAAAAAAAEEAPPPPERAERPEEAAEAEAPASKAAAPAGAAAAEAEGAAGAAAAETRGAPVEAGGAAPQGGPAEAGAAAEAPAGGPEEPGDGFEADFNAFEQEVAGAAEAAGGDFEEEPPAEAAPERLEEPAVPEGAAGAEGAGPQTAGEEAAVDADKAEASFPEKQESRMEEDYDEDYEDYEDDFADESLNASRALKGKEQERKETLDALDESGTFEDSHG